MIYINAFKNGYFYYINQPNITIYKHFVRYYYEKYNGLYDAFELSKDKPNSIRKYHNGKIDKFWKDYSSYEEYLMRNYE